MRHRLKVKTQLKEVTESRAGSTIDKSFKFFEHDNRIRLV